jgi:hypothetical protein
VIEHVHLQEVSTEAGERHERVRDWLELGRRGGEWATQTHPYAQWTFSRPGQFFAPSSVCNANMKALVSVCKRLSIGRRAETYDPDLPFQLGEPQKGRR